MLHPAKGIEFVLEALPKVIADNPAMNVLYLIVGETHPNVVKNEGESYRARLKELTTNLELEQNVKFVDRYLQPEPNLTLPRDGYLRNALSR